MSHGGGEGGGDRWLVSYSDFITLLMVLFVVLYSMGQVDVEKYKQLAESLRAAFTIGGQAKVVDAEINQANGTQEDGEPNPIVVDGIPEEPPKSEEVAGDLTEMLKENNLGSGVSVQTNVEGVLISLSEKITYENGTANLNQDAYPVLDTIIEMLGKVDNQVRIVGHTSDTPPLDSRYQNNWELSAARAIVISDYFIGKGISPDRITVSGKSSYDNIFENDTEEHRELNSRADIIVIYPVDSDIINSESILGTTSSSSSDLSNLTLPATSGSQE